MIPSQEYKIRIEKIQAELLKSEADALFVTLGKNFQYLLNSNATPSERLVLGIIPKDDKPRLICPEFEIGNFKKNTPIESELIHGWQDTQNPYNTILNELVSSLNLTDATIALSPNTPYYQFKKMELVLPKVVFFDGSACFKSVRSIKTKLEIEFLKKANGFTSEAIEASLNQLEEGLTEKEIARIVTKELQSRSGESVPFAVVQFGENSADPHANPTDRKLRKGDVVLIDAGTTAQGYNGDITNTTFFGSPKKEFLDIYEVVEEAQERATKASIEGTVAEDVDKIARDVIESKGYGKYFTHRTGHGIGLDVHEDPYIVGGNKEILLENQAHSVEPGIYIPGKFGIRIEDVVFVGSQEGQRSSKVRRRLWE